ncbi:Uncharacterised protein [Klebsiella pneumoniae]|nr:hypothetical protein DBV09_28810 [Klebsiella pneumoniae]PYZ67849.1 hypothetical protein DNK65_22900 [Citrobacter koseri]PYZ35655.1 hypothetical protein DNK74_29605 [Klebsiella pneumoniae]CAF2026941.1 hypothetical protein AI2622V1_5442 [Klebsiella pneumoniae]CAF2517381.1 hypothetical protein AI2850V1_5414 [Klebsiella pneumoniae]
MTALNSQQQADVARYIREHGNKTVISPEWSLIYFSLCQCELHQSHGNDSNLLIVFYVQIMPDDFVMQLHRF